MRIRTLAGRILAGTVILVMWGLLNHYAVWCKLLVWITTTQADLHRQRATTMRLVPVTARR